MDDGGVAKLVARTYRAATEPALLAGVFEELGDRLRVEGWHFLGWDHDAGADLVGLASWTVLDAKLLPAYDAHYGSIDPRRALAARTGPGVVINDAEHFDSRYVARSEFYQDFMRPAGLRHSIGLSLHRTASVDYQLGYARGAARGPFTPEQQRLLGALIAPLMHTVRFAEQWRALKLQAALAEQGLAATGVAVFGLAAKGRIVYANAHAKGLLRAGTPCRWQRGALAFTDAPTQARWPAALQRVLRQGQPQTLRIAGVDAGGDGWCLVLLPAPPAAAASASAFGADSPPLLALLSRLPERRVATVQQLIDALGLTPAEARLARALCGEESLQDYARASGVARTTVKTQLRSIFAKTGTTRQSALARLVAAVPPARGGETARHRGRQADPKAQ